MGTSVQIKRYDATLNSGEGGWDEINPKTTADNVSYNGSIKGSGVNAAVFETKQLLSNLYDADAGKLRTQYFPDAILGQLTFGGTITWYATSREDIPPTNTDWNQWVIINLSTDAWAIISARVAAGDYILPEDNYQSDQRTCPYYYIATNQAETYHHLEANADSLALLEYLGVFKGIYFLAQNNGQFLIEDESGPNGETYLDFQTGDWIVSLGNQWQTIDNTDAVRSVNGKTGDVKTYRDAWVSGNTYYKGDFVLYDGLLYLCIESIATSTTAPSSDTTHFKLTGVNASITTSGNNVSVNINGNYAHVVTTDTSQSIAGIKTFAGGTLKVNGVTFTAADASNAYTLTLPAATGTVALTSQLNTTYLGSSEPQNPITGDLWLQVPSQS